MKLENIYKELTNNIDNPIKLKELTEKIASAIRTETCYKTSTKTRINAIKRIASKNESRPALTGYGICDDYKVITDSYHLIMIHQDNMPLKLVATKKQLEENNINYDEYIEKNGKNSILNFEYPRVNFFKDFDKNLYNTIEIDYNDMQSYYKLHHTDKEKAPYMIDNKGYNINYLKNLIDVLGTDVNVYIPKNSNDFRPLYIENKNDEIGLICPIRCY